MKKAFTLVELVIFLIVLSVGLVTLLLVLRSANVNNATAHFMTVAGELAEGKLDQVMSDRKTQGFGYIINSNYPLEDPVGGFANYRREVDIYYVDLSDLNDEARRATDYKRIDVVVSSRVGIGADIKLTTIVSNYQ